MDSAEDRLVRLRVSLLRDARFSLMAGVFGVGDSLIVDICSQVRTAATDGINKFYDRKYFMSLTDPEARGLIVHEEGHVYSQQFVNWLPLIKEDADLANIAFDIVVNQFIVELDDPAFITLPKGAAVNPEWRHMDSGEVFAALKALGKRARKYKPLDIHDTYSVQNMDDAQLENMRIKISDAQNQGTQIASVLGHKMQRNWSEILAPQVNWRDALRMFVTDNCKGSDVSSWRKPSRRWIAQDIYMPSRSSNSMGSLVLAEDISGSIEAAQSQVFRSEIVGCCKAANPARVDLLYWGDCIARHAHYDRDTFKQIPDDPRPDFGGGTEPQVIVDYLRQHRIKPEAIVVLTDGNVDSWGRDWPAPVLWVMTTPCVAPTGVTVRLEV